MYLYKQKIWKRLVALLLTFAMFAVDLPAQAMIAGTDTTEEILAEESNADLLHQEADGLTEPVVVGEDESRRDENTKHFILSDGTRRAVMYSEAVHYEEEGKWKDIDNTLEYEDATGTYKNKANSFDVYFDEEPESDEMFSMEKDGYSISWEYVEAEQGLEMMNVSESTLVQETESLQATDSEQLITKPAPKLAQKIMREEILDEIGKPIKSTGEPLRYEDMDMSCDIEYVVTGNGVKENIILSEPTGQNTFTFEVTATGLTLVKNEDGSISIKSKEKGEEVFYIPAPFMYDDAGIYSKAVEYTVQNVGDDKYRLLVMADKEWLLDKERSYPVTIDPAITTKQTKAAIDTTFIAKASAHNTENFNDMLYLYAGWESSAYGNTRTLIKIDLPKLNPGDMVVGANLHLLQVEKGFYASTVPNQQIEAHRIIGEWEADEVTWKTKPEIDSVVYDYDFIKRTNDNNEKKFDITTAVKGWYEGTFDNNGIMIKQYTESGTLAANGAYTCFWSDKYNDETGAYPVIEILYRNNKGIEDYWSYTTLGAGATGTAYVNDYSGNLVFDAPLTSSTGNRMYVDLDLVYNGYCADVRYVSGKDESYKTVVGRGFRLNVQQTVLPSTKYGMTGTYATTWPYVYTDGDGTEHYFYKLEETKTINGTTYQYQDEDGLGLYLTTTPDESVAYQISDESGNSMYFNTKGNMRHWKNANGDKVSITFQDRDGDGTQDKDKIDYITDANGHKYTFVYRVIDGVTDDFVKTITDDAGRVITFYYDGGCLYRIQYSDGTNSYFTYAGDTNVLKTVSDQNKNGLMFTYETVGEDNKRVKRVREIVQETDGTITKYGQRLTFDRSLHNTTIIQSAGIDGLHGEAHPENVSDDIITTYQFDNYGRTVSQQVKYGNGVEAGAGAYQYTSTDTDESASGDKNKISNQASLGQNTVNLVKNSNVTGWSNWTKTTSTDTVEQTTEISTSQKYMGNKSFHIQNREMSAACKTYLRQSCTDFTAGSTYTFSAYVKTSNVTKAISAGRVGAYIQVGMFDADNTVLKDSVSKLMLGTTDTAIDNGWRRLSITFTVPASTTRIVTYLCLGNALGDVWFDCMQLEAGSVANDYNMVENSSFERTSSGMPTDWTTSTITYSTNDSGTVQNGVTTARAKKGSKSMRIIGEATKAKGLSQTILVEGNPDDTYILSGWAYANAIPKTNHSNAKFEISVKVHYDTLKGTTTGTTTQNKSAAKFNSCVSGWQYASVPIVLAYKGGASGTTYTPTAIEIICRYHYQENSTYFDHLQLIKDVAPSYQYDSKGNVTSVAANAKQKENMTYEGKDVKTYKDPLGNVTTYTYDSKHNLLTSTSPKGTVNGYTYNNHGQVTISELRDAATSSAATKIIQTQSIYNTTTSDGIQEGAYQTQTKDANGFATNYTYNYKSGKLLKVTDVAGNETEYTYENNLGKLTQVENGNAKVSYTYNGNRLATILACSISDSSKKETYSFTYDDYGNVLETKVGNKTLATNTYVNYNGLLQSSQYGNGDEIKYTYDKAGNVSMIYQKHDTNAAYDQYSSYLWQYATDGTPLVHQDGKNQLRYEYMYDSIGRLIRQNMSKTTDSSQVGYTEFGYDNRNYLNRLSNVIGSETLNQYYTYDADGLPSRYSLSTGQYETFGYDSIGRMTERKFYHASSETEPVLTNTYEYQSSIKGGKYTTTSIGTETVQGIAHSYLYDELGNIEIIYSGSDINRRFYYDSNNQLIRENHRPITTTKTWEYDDLGNILVAKRYAYSSE